jgi:hypothetical protein
MMMIVLDATTHSDHVGVDPTSVRREEEKREREREREKGQDRRKENDQCSQV